MSSKEESILEPDSGENETVLGKTRSGKSFKQNNHSGNYLKRVKGNKQRVISTSKPKTLIKNKPKVHKEATKIGEERHNVCSSMEILQKVAIALVKRRRIFDHADRSKFRKKFASNFSDDSESSDDQKQKSSLSEVDNLVARIGWNEHVGSSNVQSKKSEPGTSSLPYVAKNTTINDYQARSEMQAEAPEPSHDTTIDDKIIIISSGTSSNPMDQESENSEAMKNQVTPSTSNSLSYSQISTSGRSANAKSINWTQEIFDNWLLKISQYDKEAIQVKKSKLTGYVYAVAKLDLNIGDFIVELRGKVLDRQSAEQMSTMAFKKNLFFIRKTKEAYGVDTTKYQTWPASFIAQQTHGANCAVRILKVHGLHKVVFYACKKIKNGAALIFDPTVNEAQKSTKSKN